MIENQRIKFATEIAKIVMKEPQNAITFICSVADVASTTELKEIQVSFYNYLKNNRFNLNN